MDILLNEKFLAALLGFIGGTTATVFGPWVHWGIEKRREQLAARRTRIKHWRMMVQKVWQEEWQDAGEIEFLFLQELDFLSLKPLLSNGTRKIFKSTDTAILPHEVFESMLADIGKLEKEWNLI